MEINLWEGPHDLLWQPITTVHSTSILVFVMGTFGSGNRTRGQAALFMTMSITVMLGAIGLVVDFGWAYWRKEAAATAANSAAVAAIAAASSAANQSCGSGTTHWNCSNSYSCAASPTNPPASNLDNGCLYAKQNGFLNTGRQTVTMQAGTGTPPTAPGVSAPYYVIVNVSESIPTLFSAVLGQSWMRAASQATAALVAGTSGGCIYVLDASAVGSLNMSGTTALTSNCGVYVNSNATGAINMVGSSTITTVGNAKTNVVGTVTLAAGASITPSANTGVSPNSPADPYAANMPAAPAAGSCQPTAQFTGSTAHTIPQGTYCDEIKQTGSAILTLTSGTYVLQAGIKVTGTATVTATGPVTLYISGGGVTLSGSGGVNLSGPTSGSYQGIVIWQPSSNTTAGTVVGSSTQFVSGLIYMPSAALSYAGSTTPSYTTLVVDTLSIVGSTAISAGATAPWANLSASGIYIVQ
jgi:hypothetical protein